MTDHDESDTSLLRRVADDRDEFALERLLARHVPKVRGYLRSIFEDSLGEVGINEVMNATSLKLWKSASLVKASSVGGWLFTVAKREALDILKARREDVSPIGDHDPVDLKTEEEVDEPVPESTMWLVEQLDEFTKGLKGLQRNVMMADIAIGDSADSSILAKLHGSTKGSVDVTRHRVRQKFKDQIAALEPQRALGRGKS